MTSTSPTTFVVGAGAVATALAGAMRHGGVPVLGLWARRPEAARKAGATAGIAVYSAAPPDLVLEANAIVIAVSDDNIAQVARMLVGSGLVTRRHVLIHCSGALAAEEAFADVRKQVGGVGVMHPLCSIVDPAVAMRSLDKNLFGVQGDAAGIEMAERLVRAIGATALELRSDQMAAYHTAAAMASNCLVALVDAAAALLEGVGLGRSRAVTALLPLMEGTLANLAQRGVPNGLTGPMRRGDVATIKRHVDALSGAEHEIEQIYRLLGQRTLRLAREIGQANKSQLDAIEEVLDASAEASVESTAYRA